MVATWQRDYKDLQFRVYVTDALYVLKKEDMAMTKSYLDILREKPETRSAEEIIQDTMKNAGLRFE